MPHTSELSHDDVQKVIATIDIPSCPKVVTDAMKVAQKDDPDLGLLADIITGDPGMSAAALKMANSPMFGSRSKISSVRKAVERLGIKNTVCVVVASALRATIKGQSAAWLDMFWKRESLVCEIATLVARRQYGISPDAAYTYALFHDAAVPLMMRRFEQYEALMAECQHDGSLLVVAEAGLFPCTHPIVGSLLARNWGLPPILGQAIRFHHELDVYDLPDSTLPGGAVSLIAVTHISEHLLCDHLGELDIEVGSHLFGRACEFLGISVEDLDEIRAIVGSVVEKSLN